MMENHNQEHVKSRKSNSKRSQNLGLSLSSKDSFKDWECGPGYKCEKILG
jgi:hypothetical protein